MDIKTLVKGALTAALVLAVLGCSRPSGGVPKGGDEQSGLVKEEVKPVMLQDLRPLKTVYQDYFPMGSIITPRDLGGDRFELLNRHFNVLTAENAMKPSELQPTQGNFNWALADSLVDKAVSNGIKIHGHTLAWHQQTGAWMFAAAGREEAIENLTVHAKTVVEHFKGRVISWDVVNEAIRDGLTSSMAEDWKASLRDSPWRRLIGPEYIELVFLAAREAGGPDLKLYYNDYGLDNQNKALAVFNMVKDLNAKYPGLINGIGMQGHYSLYTNTRNVELSLERFFSLGVEVSITELDIPAGAGRRLSPEESLRQGQKYAELFQIFKKYRGRLGRVTFWGLDDNSSWRADQNPLLFDKNLQAKDAFYAVADPEKFLADHRSGAKQEGTVKQAAALYGTPAPGGTDPLWNRAPEIPIDQFLMAWQGASGTARVLWDESALYLLVRVKDTELDKSSSSPHEQDSVEVFVDEKHNRTSYFEADDGQYRVNFENETTFNPPALAAGFVSAVNVSGASYTVEMKIPFRTIRGEGGRRIGFDLQINDAKQGARQSIALWNDLSGNSYQDTSGYGILELKKN